MTTRQQLTVGVWVHSELETAIKKGGTRVNLVQLAHFGGGEKKTDVC